jgi:hypothetical protein
VIYLLAVIGLVTVAVLFWKAFGPDLNSRDQPRSVGPDDDPEFLWRLNRDAKRSGGTDNKDGPSEPVE